MSEATTRKPDTKDGVYFDDPELPEGWTRKCVQRSTGQSAGKWDVYVYNPMGRKFRSQNEVRRYLEQIGSELSPDLFCFNPYAQASTPSGRRRPAGNGVKLHSDDTPKSSVTPSSNVTPKGIVKPKSSMSSINKMASKAVKTAKANAMAGASDASGSRLKLKFDFAKRLGRPMTTGKPGRPPGKPGRPPGKPGRPPGKPGRPLGKPGRPPGKPGRPPGKPGRPPGRPGRPPGKLGRPPGRPGRPPGRPSQSASGSVAPPPAQQQQQQQPQRPPPPPQQQQQPAAPKITPRPSAPPRPPVAVASPSTAATKSPAVPKKRQWAPPESPYDLVQEKYYQDPWKLLIATIFLSKPPETSPEDVWGDPPPVLECRRARPLLETFFERWPNAKVTRDASEAEIEQLIEPLRLGEHAAQLIIRFSDEYLTKKWKSPTELYGIGRYGSDAYRLFCLGQWKQVRPLDHMLSLYHNWLWTNYKALRLD